jgi:tetratricopeptide (TPR) repeat protein
VEAGDLIAGLATSAWTQLHNFFQYRSSAEAIRRAQELDPEFALAYWGEAMTYNHPVWQEQDLAGAREVAFVGGLAAARAGSAAEADLTYEPQAVARSAVLEAQMAALLAQAEGDTEDATAYARQAAAHEEQMPFMFGPPFVDKPSYELLGEVLLAAGRKREAEEAYRAALARAPGRQMSVEGLAQAVR